MSSFARICLSLALVLGLTGCTSDLFRFHLREQLAVQTTSGKQHVFDVEIARTSHELWRGLRWRRHLGADEGMLFDLGNVRIAYFTMSDTLIPLDMLFIGPGGRVVKIERMTKPGFKGPYTSGVPVRAVLELNGGTSKRLGITRGALVLSSLFTAGVPEPKQRPRLRVN
jgi:uncharacterized membrane protein (UPF0127 family)